MARFGGQPRALSSGRAVSSVVEHRLYTPAVTGSNPVPPIASREGETFKVDEVSEKITLNFPLCTLNFNKWGRSSVG